MAKAKGNEKENSSKVGEAIEPQGESTGGQHGIRGQDPQGSTAQGETGSEEEKPIKTTPTEFVLGKGESIFYRVRDQILPAVITSVHGTKVNLLYFTDDGSGRTGGAKLVSQGFAAGQWHYSEHGFKVYMSVESKVQ